MDDMQKCTSKTGCGFIKPLSEFAVAKGKPRPRCKECDNRIGYAKVKANNERLNAGEGSGLWPLKISWRATN